jgi:AcrR family transcriptional regulator
VRRPRSDAQRNRALLIEAALAVFAERGVDVHVEAIVDRAGLGIGTLYRHFPNREALVDAIFEARTGEIVDAIESALAHENASEALDEFFERLIVLHREDPVFGEMLMRYPPRADRFIESGQQMERLTEELIDRARRQGILREDFTIADLTVLFWSLSPILEATIDVAPEAWRRHLSFVLDGLRPGAATDAPEPSLTAEELQAAMQRLRSGRFPQRR